jgi:hypothetical protein
MAFFVAHGAGHALACSLAVFAERLSRERTVRKAAQSALGENRLPSVERSEGAAMTEKWDHSLEAQITSKMHELIACVCVVNFKQEGDRRGIIERIESLTLGKDFPESFDRSQFTQTLD